MDTPKPARHSANVRRVSVYSSARHGRPSTGRESTNDNNQGGGQDDGHVRVAVRCRPMSEKEIGAGFEPIVDFESGSRIVVHDVSEQPSDQLGTKSGERRNISHVYDFDQVFDCNSRQEDVYESAVRPLIDQVLFGYNCTVFAYGQTGTGKTYTMEGASERLRTSASSRKSSAAAGAAVSTRPSKVVKSSNEKKSASASSSLQDNSNTTPKGVEDPARDQQQQQAAGIIPRTFEQIFDHVAQHPEIQFLVRASYLEIYQEEIRDLLKKKNAQVKLELHERSDIGVYVKDLTSFVCKSISEIERVMRVGNQNRIVAATDMNEHSSRSHAIFTITIEQQTIQSAATTLPIGAGDTKLQIAPLAAATLEGARQQQQQKSVGINNKRVAPSLPAPAATIRVGKLNLVDLAGSERQRKTNSFGQRQKEAIKINLSLSALGNVINSLVRLHEQQQPPQQQPQQKSASEPATAANKQPIHTPYRDSKLTRLLQDSLGGNAKTLMIAHIGPASYNYDETINTLNYAARARCIQNRPRVNEDPKDALLRELQCEIDLLRSKLEAGGGGGAQTTTSAIDANHQLELGAAATTHRDNQSSGGGVSSAKLSNGSAGGRGGGGGDGETQNQRQNDAASKSRQVERELTELKQRLASIEGKILNCSNIDKSPTHSTIMSKQQQQQKQQQQLDHQSLLKGLTREQELELERRQKELAEQSAREQAIRNELERREEAELMVKKSFESIQQEVEAKRRHTWKVLLRVKALRDEIGAKQQAYREELDELDELQWELQRQLKLKCLIMDNFVPNGHVNELVERVAYSERRNVCSIEPLELPVVGSQSDPDNSLPCCLLGPERNSSGKFTDYWRPTLGDSIRPKCEMERIGETIYPSNIRYKYEELIEPQLDP